MQQDAGLRLKCLGGRLAWGRWPISLVYRATEWSCYGLRDVFKFMPPRMSALLPGEAATSAGGSRIAPHSVVPKNNLNRASNRIPRYRQYIPIPSYSIATQVRATQSISLDITDILTIL